MIAIPLFRADTGTFQFDLASGFLKHHGPVLDGELTTVIEPFYAVLLAVIRAITGDHVTAIRVVQIAIASGGGVLFYLLALRKTSSRRVAWTAALLYAFSPYLVRQSVAFMGIAVSVVLLIALCYAMTGRLTAPRAAGTGLLLALIVLTRFSFLPIAAGAALLMARESPRHALTGMAVTALLVGTWMEVSKRIDDTYFPARIGENLFVSTSEWAEPIAPEINVDVLVPPMNQRLNEAFAARGIQDPSPAESDALLLEWTWQFVRDHPFRTARLKLRNLAYILQPRLLPFTAQTKGARLVDGRVVVPSQPHRPLFHEVIAAVFQTVLMVGCAAGLWQRRRFLRHDDALLVIVLLSIIAVNVAFFPTSRLLAPMTFVLMFYTAVACPEPRRGGLDR